MLTRDLAYALTHADLDSIKLKIDRIMSFTDRFWPHMFSFFSNYKPSHKLLDTLSNLKLEYVKKINQSLRLTLTDEAMIDPKKIRIALERYRNELPQLSCLDGEYWTPKNLSGL